MKLGQKAMEALRAEITGELKAGDDLVVAGDIALSGTALIAEKKPLKAIFQKAFSGMRGEAPLFMEHMMRRFF